MFVLGFSIPAEIRTKSSVVIFSVRGIRAVVGGQSGSGSEAPARAVRWQRARKKQAKGMSNESFATSMRDLAKGMSHESCVTSLHNH